MSDLEVVKGILNKNDGEEIQIFSTGGKRFIGRVVLTTTRDKPIRVKEVYEVIMVQSLMAGSIAGPGGKTALPQMISQTYLGPPDITAWADTYVDEMVLNNWDWYYKPTDEVLEKAREVIKKTIGRK